MPVCPITLAPITFPKTLPCGHTFELSWIYRWLENSNSCPLCRADAGWRNRAVARISSKKNVYGTLPLLIAAIGSTVLLQRNTPLENVSGMLLTVKGVGGIASGYIHRTLDNEENTLLQFGSLSLCFGMTSLVAAALLNDQTFALCALDFIDAGVVALTLGTYFPPEKLSWISAMLGLVALIGDLPGIMAHRLPL